MLVVVAHRPEDYLGVVAQLRRPPGGSARRGDVRELEIAAAVRGRGGRAGRASSRAIRARAAEVVRGRRRQPARADRDGARARADRRAADRRSRARARAQLSPDAQAMLAVSSIAARPLPVEIAAHAAGVVGGHDEATQLVGRAARDAAPGRRPDDPAPGARLTCAPPCSPSLDAEARAGWHEALARAFEDVQGPSELDSQAVVEHWLAAGHPGERRAPRGRRRAARRGGARVSPRRRALRDRARVRPVGCGRPARPAAPQGARARVRRPARRGRRGLRPRRAAPADDEAIDLERLHVEALLRRGRLDEALPAAEQLLAQIGVRIPLGEPQLAHPARDAVAAGRSCAASTSSSATPPAMPGASCSRIDVLYSIASGLAFADPALGRVVQSELVRAALDAASRSASASRSPRRSATRPPAGSRNAPPSRRSARGSTRSRCASVTRTSSGSPTPRSASPRYMSGRWRDARGHLEAGLATLREHGAGVRWEIDIGETLLARDAVLPRRVARAGAARPSCCCATRSIAATSSRSTACAPGAATSRGSLLGPARRGARAARRRRARRSATGFHLPHVARDGRSVQHRALRRRRRGRARARLDEAWPQHRADRRAAAPAAAHRARRCCARGSRSPIARDRATSAARPRATIADELIKEGAPWAVGLGHLRARRGARVARRRAMPRSTRSTRPRSSSSRRGMVGWSAGRADAPRRARRWRRRRRARGGRARRCCATSARSIPTAFADATACPGRRDRLQRWYRLVRRGDPSGVVRRTGGAGDSPGRGNQRVRHRSAHRRLAASRDRGSRLGARAQASA